jgi:hypothetical protein
MKTKLSMKLIINEFGTFLNEYGITQKKIRESYDKKYSLEEYCNAIFDKIFASIQEAFNNKTLTENDYYRRLRDLNQNQAYLLKTQEKDSRKYDWLSKECSIKYWLDDEKITGFTITPWGHGCAACEKCKYNFVNKREVWEVFNYLKDNCTPKYYTFCHLFFAPYPHQNELSVTIKV